MKPFEVKEDLMEDLDSLEEMSFDDADVQDEEEEYSLVDNIHNIENMLPEFDDYFKANRHQIFEKVLDKSLVDELEQETRYAQFHDHENITFKSDDDVIRAIFDYLVLDELMNRMKVVQDYYREQLIKIHKECSEGKRLVTPVVEIQETISKPKPTLSVRPGQFAEELQVKGLENAFYNVLPLLEWSRMTKGGFDKLIEMMKLSESDTAKEFVQKLEEEGLTRMTNSKVSYKVLSKLK